jgi:drug/metabolite transporter (DMT)-like permease
VQEKKHALAVGALAALAVVWGYNWVVMKIATRYAPPLEFAALRLLLGSIVLFCVMIALRKSLRPRYTWRYLSIGVFQSGAFVGLATWAIMSAGAGKVSILSYTMPLWVVVLGRPMLGERVRGVHAIAVGIAAAGILLILDFWNVHGSLVSDILAILAGVSWAVGVILTKRTQCEGSVDVLELTTWQMLFGGILVALVAVAFPLHPTQWTLTYSAALAYNVLFASALAYMLWIFVLQHLPARDASMGTLANPIIGILAAWLQLGETPSITEAAGMALIVLALIMLARTAQED